MVDQVNFLVYPEDDEDGLFSPTIRQALADSMEFSHFAAKTKIPEGPQTEPEFWRRSTGTTGQPLVYLEDDNAHDHHLLSLRHFGSKSNDVASQVYGIDISNRPGAHRAFVIHQYSSLSEAMRIDNTDNKAAIRVVNTENQTINPGRQGTGEAFVFEDFGVMRFKVMGGGGIVGQPKAGEHGIDITSPSTGTARTAIFRNNQPANGVEIVSSATSDGFYPLFVSGRNFGTKIGTATDGGQTLIVEKNGTSNGIALQVINKGTGNSVEVRNASAQVFTVASAGFVNVINGYGVNLMAGPGTPEGSKTAPIGSIYLRTDGTAGASFYVKETGTGNTGWVAK